MCNTQHCSPRQYFGAGIGVDMTGVHCLIDDPPILRLGHFDLCFFVSSLREAQVNTILVCPRVCIGRLNSLYFFRNRSCFNGNEITQIKIVSLSMSFSANRNQLEMPISGLSRRVPSQDGEVNIRKAGWQATCHRIAILGGSPSQDTSSKLA